jgi:hypothetical protein
VQILRARPNVQVKYKFFKVIGADFSVKSVQSQAQISFGEIKRRKKAPYRKVGG